MNEESKEIILEKASEKFFELGYSKVTMDEISSELGISKKTLYKYFPSKDALLRSIVKMMLNRVEKEIEKIISADELFETKITRLLMILCKQMRRVSKQFQLDIQRFAPSLWKEFETLRREKILVRVKELLEQAKKENIFRNDLDINLFYLTFVSAIQGILNPKTLSENSFSVETAFLGIIKILFEGTLTEEARKRIHYFDVNYEQ